MPLQNRVSAFGTIEAVKERGTLTGNRGILHGADRRLGVSRWKHHAWICCVLEFKGWRRKLMGPGTWTELFFLDEATAFAAGHRPCGYCQRERFTSFRAAWTRAHGPVGRISEVDRTLHRARVHRDRTQRTYKATFGELPTGTAFCLPTAPSQAWVRNGTDALQWSFRGYTCRRELRPQTEVLVLTPEPTVALLAADYAAAFHPTASTLSA